MPTEYEVVSTDLHYNYPDGFELTDTPVASWYRAPPRGIEAVFNRLGFLR